MSIDNTTSDTGWGETPYIFVERPRCPECECLEYIRVRSESGGDGTMMRKVVCKDCSCRYRIVLE